MRDLRRRLVAIMFTDIEGFTTVMENNEALALKIRDRHREVFDRAHDQFSGEILQYYGDGTLSIFNSAQDAVRCAINMQQAFQMHPIVPVRMGIHTGDVLFDKGEIIGNSVNIASRIESFGIGGSVLLSERVHNDIKNQSDIHTQQLGFFRFKNVEEPMRVYAVDHVGLAVPQARDLQGKGEYVQKGLRKQLPKAKKINLPLTLLASVVMLAMVLVFWFRGSIFSPPSKPISGLPVVAIPYFDNETGEPEFDILGRMAADWITSGLMQTRETKVISSQSIDAYEQRMVRSGLATDLFSFHPTITHSVEGVIYQEEDSLIFVVAVLKADSREIDFSLNPVKVSVESPLSAVEILKEKIAGHWVTQDRNYDHYEPPAFSAYKEYLLAKEKWLEDDEAAFAHLDKAIALDSLFLQAHFLRATGFLNHEWWGDAEIALEKIRALPLYISPFFEDQMEGLEATINGESQKSFKYAMQTYEQDPLDIFTNTGTAVIALESVNKPEVALAILEELPPDSVDYSACYYCLTRIELMADAYLRLGEAEKAIATFNLVPVEDMPRNTLQLYIRSLIYGERDQAVRDLLSRLPYMELGGKDFRLLYYSAARDYQVMGKKDKGEQIAGQALALYQDPKYRQSTRMLAMTYFLLGNLESTEVLELERIQNKPTDFYSLINLGATYARMGNEVRARQTINAIQDMGFQFPLGRTPYFMARIYAQLGEEDIAIDLLRQSLQEGRRFYFDTFDFDIYLEPLWDKPEYKALVSKYQDQE